MKVITLVSQKGGTGKTTLATNLAAAARQDEKEVVLVDVDPQASAVAWADDRGDDPPAVSTQAAALERVLRRAREATDLCIIDTAPHTDQPAVTAATLADLVLVPVTPSLIDLRAVQNTLQLCGMAGISPVVVLTQCRTRGAVHWEARSAVEALGAEVAPKIIGDRVAYEYAFIGGGDVIGYEPQGKAAAEVSALYKWVRKRLGL
ncbi:AAA family ATPase [Halorhodospira halophila]|uniref:AAA family ATPase n=1 Tax=Halorhodospira halophila TaxID=1053 RepID=UPI001914A9C0|nr:AAA family ATPase [Halorhodospira halophila]MBK5944813.1 hypothetical protein [Halorhodospira halophila]